MTLLAQAALDLKHLCQCATFWALAAGALGLWLLLPARHWIGTRLGILLLAVAAAPDAQRNRPGTPAAARQQHRRHQDESDSDAHLHHVTSGRRS